MTQPQRLYRFLTCLLGRRAIIGTSNEPVGGGQGDTLIGRTIEGGLSEFSYDNWPPGRPARPLTFNQGVAGSIPARLTSLISNLLHTAAGAPPRSTEA